MPKQRDKRRRYLSSLIVLAFATLAQALKQVRNIQAQICILTYLILILISTQSIITLMIPLWLQWHWSTLKYHFFGKNSLDSSLIYCILAFWKKVRTETYATDSLLHGLAVPAIPLVLNGSLEEEVVTETITNETPSLETSTYLTPDVDIRG